jgi:hypothetical protein
LEPIKVLLLRENSAYTPNSPPRIPTRVCQGHVVTTDIPTLGTNPKRSQSGSTKQEAKDLAVLKQPRRTVRGHLADCPRAPRGWSATDDGRSVKHKQNDPTNTSSLDGPCHVLRWSASNSCSADCPRRPGGLSAKPLPTRSHWPTGSKQRCSRTRKEHEEHLGKNPSRGLSAPTTWTVREVQTGAGTAARKPTREHPTTYPSMELPNC